MAGCALGAGKLLKILDGEELTELSDSKHSSGKGWNLCEVNGNVMFRWLMQIQVELVLQREEWTIQWEVGGRKRHRNCCSSFWGLISAPAVRKDEVWGVKNPLVNGPGSVLLSRQLCREVKTLGKEPLRIEPTRKG